MPIMGNGRMGVPPAPQTDGVYHESSSSSAVNRQSYFQFRPQSGGVPESDITVRVTCKHRLSLLVFTARRHASAVVAVVVCLSVRLSQVGVLLKRLNVGSCKQSHTIARGL